MTVSAAEAIAALSKVKTDSPAITDHINKGQQHFAVTKHRLPDLVYKGPDLLHKAPFLLTEILLIPAVRIQFKKGGNGRAQTDGIHAETVSRVVCLGYQG